MNLGDIVLKTEWLPINFRNRDRSVTERTSNVQKQNTADFHS